MLDSLRRPPQGCRQPSPGLALTKLAWRRSTSGHRDGLRAVVLTEITYLTEDQGFLYVSLVTAAWSRKLSAHRVHNSLHTQEVEPRI